MKPMDKNSPPPVNPSPTLGCCGIDCGLCPRYHTEGSSKCPGCYGPGFFEKHPSCPFITCCVKKRGHHTCAECAEFPCPRFAGMERRDSFVTKQRTLSNLESVRDDGVEPFITQQTRRIRLLETMLAEFNEGRSKNFYCLATALLPIADLEASMDAAEQEIRNNKTGTEDLKTRAGILRELLSSRAAEHDTQLRLRK